jgi:hypothetical protein
VRSPSAISPEMETGSKAVTGGCQVVTTARVRIRKPRTITARHFDIVDPIQISRVFLIPDSLITVNKQEDKYLIRSRSY